MIPHRFTKIDHLIVMASCATLTLLLAASAMAQQLSSDSVAKPSSSSGVISGRVLDSSGQPVTNAIAHVMALGARLPVRGAAVDSEGAFKLEGLDAGAYSEPGHAISGIVSGGQSQSELTSSFVYGVSVTLTEVQSRAMLMYSSASSYNGYTFEFYGVPDGEYELNAQRSLASGEMSASEPRHITVKGADVTGLGLTLAPLSSIAGQLSVEAHPELNCAKHRATALRETVIAAQRDRKPVANCLKAKRRNLIRRLRSFP